MDYELNQLISCLPLDDVEFVFAYGSGAVPQTGQKTSDNMVDFVVSVCDALKFHKRNISCNPSHYSIVRRFGPKWNARFQNNYAAKVYCNTLVHVPTANRQMKYSVIETKALTRDLLDWDTLYIAGRLQKPVHFVRPPVDDQLKFALGVNLSSAVRASLLQLPEIFSKEQLYLQIASLSYQGDFRTRFGEDRKKVTKIVTANRQRFDRLFLPILSTIEQVYIPPSSNGAGDVGGSDGKEKKTDDGVRLTQDGSPSAIYHHLNLLPTNVLWQLQRDHFAWRRQLNRDNEEILFAIAHNRYRYQQLVGGAIRSIVARSSARQSLKNIVTAGPWKSAVYSFRKIVKMFRSF